MSPDEEDQLLLDSIALAMEVRDDLGTAQRRIRYADRTQLERFAITLAAMVDPDVPLHQMAWWRDLAPEAREAA